MPKRIRTFIAVEIDRLVRKQLEQLQEILAPSAQEFRWVEPETIHLTLNFLGDVDERDLYAVCKTVQEIVADRDQFEMIVAGVGAFPNTNRPRVIWAGVTHGADELTDIHAALDVALGEQRHPRENRPFTAHFTVEGFSLDRLARIDRGDIDRRFEEYRRMTAF